MTGGGRVYAIAIDGATVYVGGAFTGLDGIPGPVYSNIVYWDGTLWNPLTNGLDGAVYSIALYQGDVYASGSFTGTNLGGEIGDGHIARWDSDTTFWYGLNQGLNSYVSAMTVVGSSWYVGGNFTDAGSIDEADYIARWDGVNWSALGTTPLGSGGTVTALGASGLNLYAGGNFSDAGGDANADYIALFQLDGTAPTVTDFSTPAY